MRLRAPARRAATLWTSPQESELIMAANAHANANANILQFQRPAREVERELKEDCRAFPNCPRRRKKYADWLRGRGRKKEAEKADLLVIQLQERRNVLVMQNQGLIGAQLRRFWGAPAIRARGWEECYSDGQIGLISAAEHWSPNRPTKFASYASWCIHCSIMRAVKSDKFFSHFGNRGLDTDIHVRREPLCNHEPAAPEEVEIDEAAEKLAICVHGLPLAERRVIEVLFYQGGSVDECAATLKISRETVRLRKTRAIVSLKACLGWQPIREAA